MPDDRAHSLVSVVTYISDAQRPCSTCVRSHRNAVNHAPAGVEVPPLECTFDELPECGPVPHAVPKNRYERLENRISTCWSCLVCTLA